MSEPDKSIYNLSRDYECLYGMLCDGYIAVGFVDYQIYKDPAEPPARDVVQIIRHREYKIFGGFFQASWREYVQGARSITCDRACRVVTGPST